MFIECKIINKNNYNNNITLIYNDKQSTFVTFLVHYFYIKQIIQIRDNNFRKCRDESRYGCHLMTKLLI